MADAQVDAAAQALSGGEREQMAQEAASAAQAAQTAALSLLEKARIATDSVERAKFIREAYAKETEAHGQSKLARRMQSGAWQGLAAGGGIGAATGMGLGVGLGTVVGGVVSVPTTGLGALIGAGAGALHGPWIKLGGGSGKTERMEDAKPEDMVQVMEVLQDVPEAKEQLGQGELAAKPETNGGSPSPPKERRKLRKLEIRGSKQSHCETTYDPESYGPRRPRKLEIRTHSTPDRPPAAGTSTAEASKKESPSKPPTTSLGEPSN